MTMSVNEAKQELVTLNWILGREGILDAYGHVSVRHPERADRFLLSRARSPEYIEFDDIFEHKLDGTPVEDVDVPLYLERFIHAAVYDARPEVAAVCHSHTISVLPFSISKATRLTRTINSARMFGDGVPVWDMADEFGTETDLLVRNIEQGRSLAGVLGTGALALMRGHGCVVTSSEPRRIVNACLSMDRGAKAQLSLVALGGSLRPFTHAELAPHRGLPGGLREDDRAWEYFVNRAGISG
jgi:ribulose-5-phosphate 4-epimerase/fuculose-1-phosphate aldolase